VSGREAETGVSIVEVNICPCFVALPPPEQQLSDENFGSLLEQEGPDKDSEQHVSSSQQACPLFCSD